MSEGGRLSTDWSNAHPRERVLRERGRLVKGWLNDFPKLSSTRGGRERIGWSNMESKLRLFIGGCRSSTDSLNLIKLTNLAEEGIEFLVRTVTCSGATVVNCRLGGILYI